MAFTNEQIKELEERMDWGFNCPHDYICGCPSTRGDEADYFIKRVRPLLKRLEAAEAWGNSHSGDASEPNYELYEAWRKESGKSGAGGGASDH